MTTTKTITNAWVNRTLPDIFYEEPGPIEEGMRQERSIDIIKSRLYEHYQDRDDVFVSNGVFISYDRNNGNARIRPDLFIAFGVQTAAIRLNLPNFWIWETGKVPDFVMEVASPSTAANDLGHKRGIYERLGITEYWRFDPTGGDLYGQPLAGERLADGHYFPCEIDVSPNGSLRSHSELLNLDFSWNGSAFDVLDPVTGKTIDPMASSEEALQTAEAERDAAQFQAVQSEARATQAEAEAARLREILRRLKPE